MSDSVPCGNCGAANPADAITCGTCGVILAAYRSPASATSSDHVEPSTSHQDPTPEPKPRSAGASLPAPTHLLAPRAASSPVGADRTVALPTEATSPQTDPSWEFAASQDNELRAVESGDSQTSDDHEKRGGEAAIQTPGAPIRPLDGSPGTDLPVSAETPAVPGGAVANPASDKPREHGRVLVQPATDQGMPGPAGPIPAPPSRPAPQQIIQEHRLPPKAPGNSLPFVKPPPLPAPTRAVSSDTPFDHPTNPRSGQDPLSAVPGQLLVLAGLGLVLAACLLGALGRRATMPMTVMAAAFCAATTGMLLIVVGVVILVARRSGRPI